MAMPDDERALQQHGDTLGRVLAEAIPSWFIMVVTTRAGAAAAGKSALIERAAQDARADVEPSLVELLQTDIDQQTTTPLALARRVVTHATKLLDQLGVARPHRDGHAIELHPDDHYDLTPGGFIDFGESVQEAGLTWGAAKAYVHKQRRAALEAERAAGANVVAIVPNLMDRPRFGSATLVGDADAAHAAEPSVLLVDLDRVGELEPFVSDRFPTIGFGSHVDEERLTQAKQAGFADALPRSVFFNRLPSLLGDGPGAAGGVR